MWPQGGYTGFNFNGGTGPYPSPLLNEIHTNFPAFLYNHGQFNTTRDVFQYIHERMHQRYDVFTSNQSLYRASIPVAPAVETPAPPIQRRAPWRNPVPVPIPTLQPQPRFTTIDLGLSPLSASSTNLLNQILNSSGFLDAVPVTATMAQLAANTTEMSAVGDSNPPCAVCQDTITEGDAIRRINVCSHVFHVQCIDTWLQRNVRCPVCRHDVRESSAVTN
jgi:hypothetical protein